ncbi:MAG: hypothetical protein ACW9W4_07920 [Candidatus Nitrosopumilus sp. bin_7KS]
MKTRYKIPLIVGILFVIIWPQMPHVIWIACEILPDCNTETSYASGIGLPWISINTNLFDNLSEGLDGFFMLGISFTLMIFLVLWRIKIKTLYKILILCFVFTIPIFAFMWIEYGTVCNEHVVQHLQKHSNLFDVNYDGEFVINSKDYSFGVHELNIQECVNYILEQKTLDRK